MKKIALLLIAVAYLLIYPGLTQPLLTISAMVDKADLADLGKDIIVENPDTPEFVGAMARALVENMQIEGSVEAYNKTRSILGTIQTLFDSGHIWVAFLIGLFSIIVPVLKGMILLVTATAINPTMKHSLGKFADLISKWSMADVFVMAVLVAFLAANAIQKEAGLLSFKAVLGPGFYFFLGYCLLSILGSQMLMRAETDPQERL